MRGEVCPEPCGLYQIWNNPTPSRPHPPRAPVPTLGSPTPSCVRDVRHSGHGGHQQAGTSTGLSLALQHASPALSCSGTSPFPSPRATCCSEEACREPREHSTWGDSEAGSRPGIHRDLRVMDLPPSIHPAGSLKPPMATPGSTSHLLGTSPHPALTAAHLSPQDSGTPVPLLPSYLARHPKAAEVQNAGISVGPAGAGLGRTVPPA